jgi:DNA/RNA-binding domain of Phe-tRNA-synthetase-like protein
VATGVESFTRINGQDQLLKSGDMMICDAVGPLSTVIYGPDRRTQITSATRRVLFTVYAPSGIPASTLDAHLSALESNVRLIAPQAVVEVSRAYPGTRSDSPGSQRPRNPLPGTGDVPSK